MLHDVHQVLLVCLSFSLNTAAGNDADESCESDSKQSCRPENQTIEMKNTEKLHKVSVE